MYEAIGVVLDGLTGSKTFMPPMVVDVLEDSARVRWWDRRRLEVEYRGQPSLLCKCL